MLMIVKFIKNEATSNMFDKVVSPGFSHGRLFQDASSSMLRLGDLIEETQYDRTLWVRNLQETPFNSGLALFRAGDFKTEAYIVDSYTDKKWTLDHEIKLIFDYAKKFDSNLS